MSYRRITVDGREFEYTVGKTHIKVKGVGVWSKQDLYERHLYKSDVDPSLLMVTPELVAKQIKLR
jgi:hypothetical protein